MIQKNITYTDYNGVQRTERFYFNLNATELTEWELSTEGGLQGVLEEMVDSNDRVQLARLYKNILERSYGVKSQDGRRFIKNDEVREEFFQSEAYNVLFLELASDATKLANFIEGLLPPDLVAEVKKNQELNE